MKIFSAGKGWMAHLRLRSAWIHMRRVMESSLRGARTGLAMALLSVLWVAASCASISSVPMPGASQVASSEAEGLRDPALRTGVLPNGMRYYVRENAAPAERAQLWLAVDAGSVLEDKDQLGYAHFLEHMAFNGTKNFPGHELMDFIEGAGMRFGADVNAYTSFDETVYMLTVPTDDPSYLERGLLVLEDWAAGRITIDPDEVVAERGVVLGEWRSRMLADTAIERIRGHVWDVVYGEDSRYRARWPIGTPESILEATAEPLERFYRDWYRPDLMAVIAVGDFDADAMEAEIKERFGAIPARKDARERWTAEVKRGGEPVVDIMRDKVSPQVEVLWPAPERPMASGPEGARAYLRHEIVWDLLLGHVQRELMKMREHEEKSFIHAAVDRPQLTRPMSKVAVRVITWPDSLERGLETVLTEFERVARGGMPEAALDRRKAALLARLEHAAASAVARPSRAYASEYSQHRLTGEGTLLSAQQQFELAQEILPEITSETLAEAARFWREREGLRAIVRMPKFALGFRPPTRESVLALWDAVQARQFEAEPTPVVANAGIKAAGRDAEASAAAASLEPGKVVDERVHEAAGVVEWTLSNGARVLFKESLNDPDDLRIRAWSPGGLSLLPDTLFLSPGRMVAKVMTEAAGMGERDGGDGTTKLETLGVRRLHVEIGYAEETIDIAGSPRELESLFELMHRQFVAPKLDSASLTAWANTAKYHPRPVNIHDQLNQTFARGNRRLLPVQTFVAELATPEQMRAVHKHRFGNAGDFTFIVVGAASPEEVRPLVERYLANLPSNGADAAREMPDDPDVIPFTRPQRTVREVLPFPRADVLLVFDGKFPTEPEAYLRERQRLEALTLVLQRRLRDKLREEIAGTYGVSVQGRTYRLYDERFRVMINYQAAPESAFEMGKAMMGIFDALREEGATVEELERVTAIQHRLLETALQQNDFWLNRLELHERLGLPIDRIVAPYPEGGEGRLTLAPSDLKQAAQAYLPENSYIHLAFVPKRGVESRIASDKKDESGETKKDK